MQQFPLWLVAGALSVASLAASSESSSFTEPLLIDVGGHSLHLHCSGSGSPTVLLDAGLGGTHLDWSLVQPKLSQYTRVCSYDRAGYGLSEMGPSPRDAHTLASELAAMLKSPKIATPVLLVGHSLAGFHLRELAQRQPQIVSALVLIDSAHEDQFKEFRQRAQLRLAPGKGDRVRMSPPAVPKQLPKRQREQAQTYANEQKSLLTLRSELTNFISSAAQLKKLAPSVSQPLLVISRGKAQWRNNKDAALREKIWQELQLKLRALNPHATQIIATDSGHFVHLEQPQLVVDVLSEFIAELRRDKADASLQTLASRLQDCKSSKTSIWHCGSAPSTAALEQAPREP